MSVQRQQAPPPAPLPLKLLTGAVAGVIGTTIMFPVDMVKTRLQGSGAGEYSGPVDAARKIHAQGGWRGFYRGLLVNLIGVTPEKALKLAANEGLRERLADPVTGQLSVSREVAAGGGAGIVQVVATTPMELLKIHYQMDALREQKARAVGQAFTATPLVPLLRKLGVRGVYSGLCATLLRDVPFSVVFFPLYAHAKDALKDDQGQNSVPSLFLAGTICGGAAAWSVTPMDMVKTRLQLEGGRARYGSWVNCFRTVLREEGAGKLFSGAVPRMCVVGPLFGITLLSFEVLKKVMSTGPSL